MRKHVIGSLVVISTVAIWACSSSSSGNGSSGGGGDEGGTGSSGSSSGSASSSGSSSGSASSSGSSSGSASSSGGGGEGGASEGGGNGEGGSGGEGGGAEGGGGVHGWTALTLPQETFDGGTVDHATFDWVTDIRFTSATAGLVSTFTFANPDSEQGGAIFGVNGSTLTVVSSGTVLGDGNGNGGGYFGLYAAGTSIYSPMDSIEREVSSTNGGTSFGLIQGGNGFYNSGLQPALSFAVDGSGHWWAADNFNIYKATTGPASTTTWTIVTPDVAVCDAPSTYNSDPTGGGATDRGGMNLHVSSDGQTIVYPQSTIAVCVSTNGGTSWAKVTAPNPPANAPEGRNVYFMDDTHGILFGGDDLGATAFVYTTANGGTTWTAATVPAQGASDVHALFSAFFAPDHLTGWLVGKQSIDDAAPPPLLWKTTDGGATWTDITTTSFSGTSIDPTGFSELTCGFALDASHIWLGGHDGSLFSNNDGGS